MDFEHTEDPDTLDQMNKAKEGMSWYSGGVVGILNGFFNIVSNGVNVLGVIAIIAVTCPLLLPIQIISLVLITIFTNKSNKLDIEYFKKLSKINRLFGYFFYQLSDPSNGKELFRKRNGQSTYVWNAADEVVVGDKSPDAQGSFGINVAWKGFYLNTTFLYQWGAQDYNETIKNKVEEADIVKMVAQRLSLIHI